MQGALKSALDNVISTHKAVILHGVPHSSFQDHLSGLVTHERNPDRPLNVEEESELTSYLIEASNIGYSKTH